MQAAKHQVAIAPMQALGKGRVPADAPIDLRLLIQARPPGASTFTTCSR